MKPFQSLFSAKQTLLEEVQKTLPPIDAWVLPSDSLGFPCWFRFFTGKELQVARRCFDKCERNT